MTFRIRLDGRDDSFVALPGESLLDAGRRAGFTFPQACRNGNCFRCEGRLLAGEVEHRRTHARLQAAESPEPVLPCIVEARSDCRLRVEGVYGPGELPVLDVAAQVVAVEMLNHNVARIGLRLPAGRRIARLAGQYLEILDPATGAAYAFSIASPPESGRDIELHVRHGEDNPASLAVMALLRGNAVVRVRLPMGDCSLAGEPRLPLLIVAGSTGFSQAKAFVEHAIACRWKIPVALYRGVREPADLYLPDLPEQWARQHANIRCISVISHAADTRGMRHGHVHEAVLADRPDFANLLVYGCGSPPMVYAALDAFTAAGLPRAQFFSDVLAWAPR